MLEAVVLWPEWALPPDPPAINTEASLVPLHQEQQGDAEKGENFMLVQYSFGFVSPVGFSLQRNGPFDLRVEATNRVWGSGEGGGWIPCGTRPYLLRNPWLHWPTSAILLFLSILGCLSRRQCLLEFLVLFLVSF